MFFARVCMQLMFIPRHYSHHSKLCCAVPQKISAMTSRIVTVARVSGHLLDLEMPCGNIACEEIMREIKHKTGIHRCEQQIICDGVVLAPLDKITNHDDDVIITLVRVKATCWHCGRRQRRRKHLYRCSVCPGGTYCGSVCQRADWRSHREVCWKYKDQCE